MRSIAVTGNIASGKSTVARLFELWGAVRIDADETVRGLQARGTPVFAAIVDRFGDAMVQEDGSLDRAALRRLILADADARAALNALIHPAVFSAIRTALADLAKRGTPYVVVEIPLLFETGTAHLFDRVVLVESPRPLIVQRLEEQRHLDRDSAERFLDAQAMASLVRQQSDFVILNDGSLDHLRAAAQEVWRALTHPA